MSLIDELFDLKGLVALVTGGSRVSGGPWRFTSPGRVRRWCMPRFHERRRGSKQRWPK